MPFSFQTGYNNESAEIHWKKTYSFSIPTEPILTTIGTSGKEFPDSLKEVAPPFSRGDNNEIAKLYWPNKKKSLSRGNGQRKLLTNFAHHH